MTVARGTMSTTRAALAVATSACCFGAIPVLVSLAVGTGASLTSVLAYRYAIAAVVLAAMVVISRESFATRRQAVWIIIVGGGGQTLVAFLGLSALEYVPVATSTFLFYTFPAWVALGAAIRRTERITRTRAMALGLSLLGITVMIGGSATLAGSLPGVLLALSAAISYSVYIPAMEHLQKGLNARATALLVCIGAGIAFLVLAALDASLTVAMHRTAWLVIVTLAIVSTVAAFQLFLSGLSVLGPVRTAILSTVEPFFAALMGAWLLAQPLTVATIAGGALIIGAVVLLQRRPNV